MSGSTPFSAGPEPTDPGMLRVCPDPTCPPSSFGPGGYFRVLPAWSRVASVSKRESRVRSPARVHLGLGSLEQKLAPGCHAGGAGFSVECGGVEVSVREAERDQVCNVVAAHLVALVRHLCPALPPVRVDVHNDIPVHRGFGSHVAENTAVLAALNDLLGRPFPDVELMHIGRANYVERAYDAPDGLYHGITTGLGTAALLLGGLVQVAASGQLVGTLPLAEEHAVVAIARRPLVTATAAAIPVDLEAYASVVQGPLVSAVRDREPSAAFGAIRRLEELGTFRIAAAESLDGSIAAMRRYLLERGALQAGVSTGSHTLVGTFAGRREAEAAAREIPAELGYSFEAIEVCRVGRALQYLPPTERLSIPPAPPVHRSQRSRAGNFEAVADVVRQATRGLTQAAVMPNMVDDGFAPGLASRLLRAVAVDPNREPRLRIYVDGRPWSHEFLAASPPQPGEDLERWKVRCFGDVPTAIIINQALDSFGPEDALLAQLTGWMSEVVASQVPILEAIVFIGDYRSTPFGAHLDNETCRGVLHANLGPGTKRMLLWDEAAYLSARGSRLPTYDIESVRHCAQAYDIPPGALFFLPPKAYHVGENQGFGCSVSVAIKDLAPAAIADSAIQAAAQDFVASVRLDHAERGTDGFSQLRMEANVAELVRRFRGLRASNAGFEGAAREVRCNPGHLSGARLKRRAPFRPCFEVEGERCALYVRGRYVSVKRSDATQRMMSDIATSDAIDVEAFAGRFSSTISRRAVLRVLTLLVAYQGFDVA